MGEFSQGIANSLSWRWWLQDYMYLSKLITVNPQRVSFTLCELYPNNLHFKIFHDSP